MNGHEYTVALGLLWMAIPLGFWLARNLRHDWRYYPIILAPLAVIQIGNFIGLFDFVPLNSPLPDFGETWNPVIYSGVMTGLSVFAGLRIQSHYKDKENDPR